MSSNSFDKIKFTPNNGITFTTCWVKSVGNNISLANYYDCKTDGVSITIT